TFCRTLTMTNPKVVTSCDNAARAGKDRFTCSGTGRDLIPQNSDPEWFANIYLQIRRPDQNSFSSMIPACSTRYSRGVCSGGDCISCTNSNTELTITINRLLTTSDSRGIVRLLCFARDYTLESNDNFTLPEIVDINNYSMTLTVDGPSTPIYHTRCQFAQSFDTQNIFMLCCDSHVTPCYAQIKIGGVVVAKNGAPCVTYVPTSTRTALMVLHYSLCSQTDYIIGGRCTMQTGSLTTVEITATTTTTTYRGGTTARPMGVTTRTGKRLTNAITDPDEATTDRKLLTTSPKLMEVETSMLSVLFWVAISVAVLVTIIAIAVYCMTRSKPTRKSKPQPKPQPKPQATVASVVRPSPEPKQLNQVKESASDLASVDTESAVD
ncbi:unnamed protein product, partial [Candidula unifasciata]